jgi:hypothetical protein
MQFIDEAKVHPFWNERVQLSDMASPAVYFLAEVLRIHPIKGGDVSE